jgi:hypothetical protein
MVAEYPYKNINQVMYYLRKQIIDSVEWCYNNIPVCSDPKELFYTLKKDVTFKDDPEGDELLQTAETLFDNNYHGRSGHGDCDCFTILAIASFIAQGWGHMDIVLAGRNNSAPVHIYAYIKFRGENFTFDLTEPNFNQERYYQLKQVLPITFYK